MLLQIACEGGGQQKNTAGIQRDQFVEAELQVTRSLRKVFAHEAQGIAMDSMGPVMLVAENEEKLRLDPANLEMLHGKETDLQEVLKLPGQLSFVVDDHEV
mmetsp:Transcript_10485/g.24702  ORF Transcript_10485/g.24702 Transcript_10485/m.24702 type:complete len:101 (-) Transcript_10485:712-1014(-)